MPPGKSCPFWHFPFLALPMASWLHRASPPRYPKLKQTQPPTWEVKCPHLCPCPSQNQEWGALAGTPECFPPNPSSSNTYRAKCSHICSSPCSPPWKQLHTWPVWDTLGEPEKAEIKGFSMRFSWHSRNNVTSEHPAPLDVSPPPTPLTSTPAAMLQVTTSIAGLDQREPIPLERDLESPDPWTRGGSKASSSEPTRQHQGAQS